MYSVRINQLELTIENRQSFVLHEFCRKKVLISNKKRERNDFSGCKMNLSEPSLGRIYQEIGTTSGQEQSRFEVYTSARVMDNTSYKKTCDPEFRKFLHEQDWFYLI